MELQGKVKHLYAKTLIQWEHLETFRTAFQKTHDLGVLGLNPTGPTTSANVINSISLNHIYV